LYFGDSPTVFFSFVVITFAWFYAEEKPFFERKLFVAYHIKVYIAFIVKQSAAIALCCVG